MVINSSQLLFPNLSHWKKKSPVWRILLMETCITIPFMKFFMQFLWLFLIAMKTTPVPGNIRVPTSAWSGYGLSHSSPASELEHRKKESFAASLLDVMNKKTSLTLVLTSSFPTLNFKWYYFHNSWVISGFLHGMNEISDILGPEERRFYS